jgi:dihydrolipoamide dehydrogenase
LYPNSIIEISSGFNYLKHASDYGLTVSSFDKDFPAVVQRSRTIASDMSKGVQFLMKKNKIDVIIGVGKLKPGKN